VKDAHVTIRVSHMIIALSVIACGFFYLLSGLLFLEILLAVAGIALGSFGLLILPRKASRKQWKRTLGVWAGALACGLSAGTIFCYEQAPDALETLLFAVAAMLAGLLTVLLLWESL